jgi:hypothetical protein
METYMGKAVFDAPASLAPNDLVKRVYDTLNLRSNQLTKTVSFMPSALPEQPGTPNVGIKSIGFGIATFSLPQTTCDGAYAIMTGFDKGVSSSTFGTSDSAQYTACIYPYKDANRVYFIGNFISSSSGGLQGMLADSMKSGIAGAGKYDNIFASWFDSLVMRFKEYVADAKQIELVLPQ